MMLLYLIMFVIFTGNIVLRSTIRVPSRLASQIKYVNVNRDDEFENLSWSAMSDQAISYAFVSELCRGN